MRTSHRFITLALGALVVLGNTAYAVDDSKFINGGACYPTFTNPVAGIPNLNRFSGLINLEQGQVQVSCPVVRDRLLGGGTIASGAAAAVTMRVDGHFTGQNISCTLQSLDGFGQVVDSDTRAGGATGETNLVLRVDQSATSGFYAIQCRLPNRGHIKGYRLVEPTPTDTD
jgi:hypothetical protein